MAYMCNIFYLKAFTSGQFYIEFSKVYLFYCQIVIFQISKYIFFKLMNDYEISKLKKELQRKHELLKEEQQDRQYTQKQLVLVQAERDKYHSELIIARQQIENIDKIIAENVREMKAKLEQQNSDSINQLKQLKQKLRGQLLLNQKLVEENRNKDATIAQLSARLREMSKKYKDPSLLVNTKQISEQAMITHNQFYKLTEKYNKLSKDMQNIMAENKILRKLHGVPDNFGFDLEEIKIAQKQQLEDYKAQCRKLQTQIEELQAERTQLRYRLRQYNTLYSNKGERYKDMTQQQLQLLDSYAINLKEGKYELPQIDKSQKEMEREILKLRAQVQVLQNKGPMSMMQFPANNNNQGNNQANDRNSTEQMKKFQQQIKAMLEPFAQDMKKLSEANLTSIIQNLQNIQNNHNINQDFGIQSAPTSNFKGPIPLPIAHNDWSKIKEGYSFIYSSKIPIDMKDLDSDVSFDVVKARYQVAALQLQNIESLKLLKQKQKIQNQLSRQLFELRQKYKKCLKVQDQLFIRYFKDKEAVNDKIKRLELEKHALNNQKQQLQAKLDIISNSYNDMNKKGDIQKRLQQYTSRLAISEAEVLKLQRKYQIISEEQVKLRQTYTNLEGKTIQAQFTLKQKLIHAKNNQRQLSALVNQVLDSVKDSVSGDVHNTLLSKLQLMNDKSSNMINKQTELRLKVEKLQSVERDSGVKNEIIQNLREDSLQILLELEIVKNRLKAVDQDYRSFCDTFDRLITYINENNISLMTYFKRFDRDGSGQLNKQQFESALNALGFKMTTAQLDLLYAQFDLDGGNSVTYKQFIRKMRRAGAISRSKEEEGVLKLFKAIQHSKLSIKSAFQIIDVDQSGSISKSEMQTALARIGINTSAQTVEHIFKMCDYDGDNSITCSELQKLYKQMVRESDVLQKQIYSQQIDWKLAFILKIEEVSLKFNSSLAQTFKKLDDDGNAVLTIAELSEFIKKSGITIERSSLQQLFNFLDRQRDGKIQYGQFLKILAEAKSEQKRIQRIKYIKERTNQLKAESQILIASKKQIENQSLINRTNETEKLKIRISALDTKHTNLIKKFEKISKELATKEQEVADLKHNLQIQERQKMKNYDKYIEQQLSKINLQKLTHNGLSQADAALLRRQANELKIKNVQLLTNVELYKGLYEGLTDKHKGQELRLGKIEAQRNKYYDIVKDLQSSSDLKAQLGRLNIQIQYSKRNEEIIGTKYDKVIDDLRKIDEENKRLAQNSMQKEKEIINTHVFFQQKTNLQQRTIDDLTLKIIPTVTIDKMEEFIVKLRQISNSKSNLQQQNKMIRQKNYNLQVRNDYIENQKLHIQQLQRKLRNQYTDDSSKAIIDLTKKLSDYKMSELKAKRQLSLLKQKQEYYLRINNTHTDNIKELETELSNWEVKFNEREEFWRKRLSDQMKLMDEFQQQANRAKQEQFAAMNYFNQKNSEQQSVNKKLNQLNPANLNNVSQFIQPTGQNMHDDQYTEKLLQKIQGLEQELMAKEREISHFKASIKQIVPEANLSKLIDMGSQMNISTNSFVLQTQLTGSQLKSNARRFLNNQKQIQVYYKQQNARITQAAQQSIDTLQRIIDDKNEQLKKKERIIQDLKKQFMESKEQDCRQIQKLNQQLKELRSKQQMGNLNEIMSKTTNKNFYPSSKAESKVEEYQRLIDSKDIQIRNLQEKYDKLLITKTSAQNQKTAAKNAVNNDKLKQKMDELNYEREVEKKKFQQKQKELLVQIDNLKKVVTVKTKKIEQLNNSLKDIKESIINQKNVLTQSQVQNNIEQFVGNMTKGTSKNDALLEQHLQNALVQIKTLQGQNKDLKEELNKAKDAMGKTAHRFGK